MNLSFRRGLDHSEWEDEEEDLLLPQLVANTWKPVASIVLGHIDDFEDAATAATVATAATQAR
jgi:hypothetical protein